MGLFGANMRSWIRQPKSGRRMRSPGAVPRMMKIDWRTFSSSAELDTPPFKLIDTGNRNPLPRNSPLFDMRSPQAGYGLNRPWMNFLHLGHEIFVVYSTSSTVSGR